MENFKVKSVDGVEVQPAAEEQKEQVIEQVDEVKAEAAAEEPKGTPTNEAGDFVVNLSKPPKKEDDAETQEEGVSAETTESVEEDGSPIEIINETETKEVNETSETYATGLDKQLEAAAPAPQQEEVPQVQLPENVEKLVSFMEETGGTLEDYVSLNKDLSDYDDSALLREYYKQSKPSWDDQDVRDHMEDQFSYDEELDDAKDVRARKRAMKDELYKAKQFLEGNREKYYADLKLRKQNDIPQEYQEAWSLANSYKESVETNNKLKDVFSQKTAEVFSEDFKGFDFKLGDNTYRYKVSEPQKVKEYQSDINNFVGEFLAEDGTIGDAKAYHKAMYAAKNVDKIAKHFYEQGRAEALKQSAKEAKNINMDPRADMSANVTTKSGTKVRVVNDQGFSGKLKLKNYNNR